MTSPIDRAERNMISAACRWSWAGGGFVSESPGLTCTHTPVPMRPFNQVFLTQPPTDAADFAAAINRYRESSPRFRLRARPEIAAQCEGLFARLALTRLRGQPCMAHLDPASLKRDDRGLEVRPVVDARTLANHIAVVARAFGWEHGDLARVFTSALIETPGWGAFVGYTDGKPVATAQLLAEDGVAGIYYVATAESHRRKGYGDAVTRRAIIEGVSRGCDIATLQASPAGYPVYNKMGFTTVAEYVTYAPDDASLSPFSRSR